MSNRGKSCRCEPRVLLRRGEPEKLCPTCGRPRSRQRTGGAILEMHRALGID